MKKKLLLLLMCTSTIAFCQNDDKKKHAIDVDAIRETELTGDVGLRPTIMSVPAKATDVTKFLKPYFDKKYLTFPESRENSIRLLDSLPKVWLSRNAQQLTNFTGKGRPGEYYVFQIGVYAAQAALHNMSTYFSALKNNNGIAIKDVTCFNTEGVAFTGKDYKKTVNVAKGHVQPLWFGIQIPDDAIGTYKGVVQIKPEGLPLTVVSVTINVEGNKIANRGYDHETNLSRLAWLNSRIGLDNDITTGFQQLDRTDNLIRISGRSIRLSPEGLPQDIETFFDHNNAYILPKGEPILAKQLKFIVERDGKPLVFTAGATTFTDEFPGGTRWATLLKNPDVTVTVHGNAQFDGFIGYTMDVTPLKDMKVGDIRLEMLMDKDKSQYMMGLDKEGGYRPDTWKWKWDVINKDQDEVWMGGVNGGLKIKFKGANYHRQLVNIYYSFGPLKEPESWGNGTKGGININTVSNGTLLNAYSGERLLRKGETYHFNFDLLVTPFKTINKNVQFGDRYYHTDIDTTQHFISTALQHGANIINIHHKKDIYPFLDYPYMDENTPDLKAFIDSVHAHDLKAKIYYTTREISVNTKEIWAMRSLDSEIIMPGPGSKARTLVNPKGVHPWLAQNFKDNFIPGWVATFTHGKYKGRQDLAVLTSPDSRINNFYLEGLDWMCKNIGIDGLYLDDLALDRETMKRARKILDRERPVSRIDMHTWNHYNEYGKYASSLNVYMDQLPYIDQLWIGEARNYDLAPDYWLIEISGIPFGLTSQMLNKGGNIWRGMNYGITDRLGWFRAKSPEYMWKFWDEYNIDKKDMIGFWDTANPVKCDNPETKATIYKGRDEVLISVANYSDKPQSCRLNIDWAALNLSPENTLAFIPAITEFQDEQRRIDINKPLNIEAAKGFIIVLKRK
ncbi:MAG: glycoside hydrolase domain-containing protein [Mucilaginibacter sp.]